MYDFLIVPYKYYSKYYRRARRTVRRAIRGVRRTASDFWYYDILGYYRPRRKRKWFRVWVPKDHPYWHCLSKYQPFPRPKWYNWTRDRFGARPINFTYEYITLIFQFEQFWIRRKLWLFLHKREFWHMRRFYTRRSWDRFRMDITIFAYILKAYTVPTLVNWGLFIISSPLFIFDTFCEYRKYIRIEIINECITVIVKLIERALSIKLHKYFNLFDSPYFSFRAFPFKYFKYYIGTPLYNFFPYVFFLSYKIIKYSFFSNRFVYILMELFTKPFIFPIVVIIKLFLLIINKLKILLIIKKIYYFILNLFLFKKFNNSFINELKNKELYVFKQFSQNCLKTYNLITFSYNYYFYFWFEYIIYLIIGVYYYILFLYNNIKMSYCKFHVRIFNYIDYIRIYSYYLVLYITFIKSRFGEYWAKLSKSYRNTYYFLFGLDYNTYFYIFVKYLGIYTLKTIIFFGCWAFFDCYAFYFYIYYLILAPIIRKLVALFMAYVYDPLFWFFLPHDYPLSYNRYWFIAFCFYSTFRYFDDISGDEEEDDEEDALVSPMAVGYYDGFMHKDLYEDFPVYFAEDAIDYQYNKKVPWRDKKLLWADKKLKMYI